MKKLSKFAIGALAASSLLAVTPAAAQGIEEESAIGFALIGGVAVAIGLWQLLDDDNDRDVPVSP